MKENKIRSIIVLILLCLSTYMSYSNELHIAVESNDYDKVQKLISSQTYDINSKDINGYTPLHLAAKNNNYIPIVNLLLDNGADIEAISLYTKNTPICLAVNNNAEHIVKFLLDRGANIEFEKEDTGSRPLHLAVSANALNSLSVLILNKACITAQDKNGNTPLHIAIQGLNKKNLGNNRKQDIQIKTLVIQLLLSKIEIGVNIKNNKGNTPLHELVEYSMDLTAQDLRHILVLLIQKQANVDIKNKDNITPLEIAKIFYKFSCTFQKKNPISFNSTKQYLQLITDSTEDTVDKVKLFFPLGLLFRSMYDAGVNEHYQDLLRKNILEVINILENRNINNDLKNMFSQPIARYSNKLHFISNPVNHN